jgi:alkyl hydroperoxide reductase subunit D
MKWVSVIQEMIPEYAKDAKINLDTVLNNGTIPADESEGIALSAALATGNTKLTALIQSNMENAVERDAALGIGVLMAQNNVWYSYVDMTRDLQLSALPAMLRMSITANNGGTTKERFEAYSLAASIVGKCQFCTKTHYDNLKKLGYTVEQLRDLGRIVATINSIAKVLNS